MTHSGGKPHNVGDKGQQYEVRFTGGDGVVAVFGWSDDKDGAERMCRLITRHPVWRDPFIVDREAQP